MGYGYLLTIALWLAGPAVRGWLGLAATLGALLIVVTVGVTVAGHERAQGGNPLWGLAVTVGGVVGAVIWLVSDASRRPEVGVDPVEGPDGTEARR